MADDAPTPDPRSARRRLVGPGMADLSAALAVTLLAVPQGIAYALIAGLPPVMGLYAATLPAIVGSLLRSSRFVVSGPTNAVSLLVGAAVADLAARLGLSPAAIAAQVALAVGIIQITAGGLRLGSLVDYISKPVVLGYITGAGVLIGLGQLPHLTGTPGGSGNVAAKLVAWAQGVAAVDPISLAIGFGTLLVMVLLRRVAPKAPAELVALGAATVAAVLLARSGHPVSDVGGVAPVPRGLPPLQWPGFAGMELLSLAFAVTVLSLVESTAVARRLAEQTGEPLDSSREFMGQGASNVVAALTGGYAVSGSLSRSSLNLVAGARSRWAGVLSGVFVLVVAMVAAPVVERVPVAALAGLLLLIAWDLIDRPAIRRVMRAGLGDRGAFVGTLVGTWTLPLDQAIYLGVAISVVMFVRRARLLAVRELVVDRKGRLREALPGKGTRCPSVRVLHVEGALFFGSAEELRSALMDVATDPHCKVLIVRLKRAQGLDTTCIEVLESVARRLRSGGRCLVLVGMREPAMAQLHRLGAVKSIGPDNLFPTQAGWFRAMDEALVHAIAMSGDHSGHDCPLTGYLKLRGVRVAS